MISGETHFLHPTNEWAYSSSMQDRQLCGHADPPTPTSGSVAGGQPPALCRRLDPGQRLPGAPGHALRAAAVGRALKTPSGGHSAGLRCHLFRRLAAAGGLARRDRVLRLAQRPHVLRRLPRPAPGLLPTHAEGRKGHSLHRLERTRFLLQKRPGRGGVRRSGAASLPSAAPGLQHSRILGVEALGRGDRVWPLRSVRAQLLAAGHQPKVSLRGLCEWSAQRWEATA